MVFRVTILQSIKPTTVLEKNFIGNFLQQKKVRTSDKICYFIPKYENFFLEKDQTRDGSNSRKFEPANGRSFFQTLEKNRRVSLCFSRSIKKLFQFEVLTKKFKIV